MSLLGLRDGKDAGAIQKRPLSSAAGSKRVNEGILSMEHSPGIWPLGCRAAAMGIPPGIGLRRMDGDLWASYSLFAHGFAICGAVSALVSRHPRIFCASRIKRSLAILITHGSPARLARGRQRTEFTKPELRRYSGGTFRDTWFFKALPTP